ncbi:Plakophilin-4 [Liparis tanakae]|uniref:Plakophilin-4 n=1 Tax=Liparis tanakae TaxID=230148 RepID=A0A4Z2J2W9_9TELE|nr:Plakophilin-4 [Liparis tanakae]
MKKELQFERLTRELEVERQIVANQLERCRLGAESPGTGSSSSSEKSLPWRTADASAAGDAKSRVTDSSQSPSYRSRAESEQVSVYSPEPSSLHERPAGKLRSSNQINSYSDSGYQDASSGYVGSQNLGKAELRMQHSFPGAGTGTLGRNTRAEGQASAQSEVIPSVPGRAMRRVSSVPSRSHSPGYVSSMSPSRGSLRTVGSAYGSPVVTEPKPLSSIFSTTLPSAQRAGHIVAAGGSSPYTTQKSSPAALRRVGSANSRSGGAGRTTSPYQASAGSSSGRMGSPLTMVEGVNAPLTKQPTHSASPQNESENKQRPWGIRSSYASQHSQLGPDFRSAVSPDRHIAPIYEDRTFQGPLYRSPTQQGTLYRSASGVGSLQRTPSQRSAMIYQRNNYALNTAATYADPYRSAQYRPADPSYTRQAAGMDDGANRSPSIDSIQKDPR